MIYFIVVLTVIIAGYFFIKAAIFFIAGCYRFLKPMIIMIFKGTDAGLQSEVEKTKEFKKFEDELKDLL
jgi:hypothetical protein